MTHRIAATFPQLSLFTTCLSLMACGTAGPADPESEGGGGTGSPSGGGPGADSGGTLQGVGGTASGGGTSGGGAATGGMESGGMGSGGVPSGGVGSGGVASGGMASGEMGTGGSTMDTGGSGGLTANPDCEASGFHVQNGQIMDSNCNPFVFRGVNVPHAWYESNTQSSFVSIAALGGNSVRVVLATGAQYPRTSGATVSSIISWAKMNNLVALLEVHDSTGYGDSEYAPDAVHPDDAVSYWTSSDILSAIQGQEAFVMINIANEPFGNDASASSWSPFHSSAVAALRQAGLTHTLVVDAPNWGQDWDSIMRDDEGDAATSIFNADPNENVVFSVHMYDVYDTASTIRTYFDNFAAHGYPLIVGEFGADHGSSGDVDEATIMAEAQTRGLGYLGWSWSGNSGGVESLDLVLSFNADDLSAWGDTLFYGANGIADTSELCTCFTQ